MKNFLFINRMVAEDFACDVNGKAVFTGDGFWSVCASEDYIGLVLCWYDWGFIGFMD